MVCVGRGWPGVDAWLGMRDDGVSREGWERSRTGWLRGADSASGTKAGCAQWMSVAWMKRCDCTS